MYITMHQVRAVTVGMTRWINSPNGKEPYDSIQITAEDHAGHEMKITLFLTDNGTFNGARILEDAIDTVDLSGQNR